MLKKVIILFLCIFIISGCENKIENEKNLYLKTKSILEENTQFNKSEELPCDITISLDRISKEKITYQAVFNSPKENMNNIKILIIHNQYTEDTYPSIGLLDNNVKNLLKDNKSDITLKGSLDTTIDIKALSIEFKVWLEYADDNNNKHTIYYKTTI